MTLADPVELPTFVDTPLFTQRVTLNGIGYVLRFDYSGREDRWYLSLLKADGVTYLRRGIKIVANWNTFRLCRLDGRPAGALFFSDVRDVNAEAPSFRDLGRRVVMYYTAAT